MEAYREGAIVHTGIRGWVRQVLRAQNNTAHTSLLAAKSGLTDVELAWPDALRGFRKIQLFNAPRADGSGIGHLYHGAQVSLSAIIEETAMTSNTEAMSELGKAMRAFTDSWRAVEGWNYWFLNGGIGKARGF